jgi:hypothetical protein
MTFEEAQIKYGQIVDNVWYNESKWCHIFDIPFSWFPAKRVYCNRDFVGPFWDALKNIDEQNLQREIRSYNGIFNIRKKRTCNEMSTHSYGISIDLNTLIMPLGSKTLWTPQFLKCWEDAGFINGEIFNTPDPQHFQLKGLW